MRNLPLLTAGDSIEVIAPASRCTDAQLAALIELLSSWGLCCIVEKNIFGDDLLCANTDKARFEFLKTALHRPKTKAIICARGGYGSLRLIPALTQVTPPPVAKLFLGMSDITALNLYLQQQWQWPVLHGALALDKFSPESIDAVRSILFGSVHQTEFFGSPLNAPAEENRCIESTLIGGNLCLVQTSIGTRWQINGKNKIIFLEEVNERGYRIDRILEHLRQADIFKEAAAILFGDFTQGTEPDGSSLIEPVLKRFAEQCELPVVRIPHIGHGYTNFPLPLGTKAKLQLGHDTQLISML